MLEREPKNKYTLALNWLAAIAIFTTLLDSTSTYIALQYFGNCLEEANPVPQVAMAAHGTSYIFMLFMQTAAMIALIRISRLSSILRVYILSYIIILSTFADISNILNIIKSYSVGC